MKVSVYIDQYIGAELSRPSQLPGSSAGTTPRDHFRAVVYPPLICQILSDHWKRNLRRIDPRKSRGKNQRRRFGALKG